MLQLSMLSRYTVGLILLLSATWKLRHQDAFLSSIAGVSWLQRRPRTAVGTIVALEALSAVLFLVGNSPIYALPSALLLVSVTFFLARTPSLPFGCGCWRNVGRLSDGRAPYLARNILIGFLLILAAVNHGSIPAHQELVIGAMSALIAPLLLEMPNLIEVLSPFRFTAYSRPASIPTPNSSGTAS
jgi:hypothetical protein